MKFVIFPTKLHKCELVCLSIHLPIIDSLDQSQYPILMSMSKTAITKTITSHKKNVDFYLFSPFVSTSDLVSCLWKLFFQFSVYWKQRTLFSKHWLYRSLLSLKVSKSLINSLLISFGQLKLIKIFRTIYLDKQKK